MKPTSQVLADLDRLNIKVWVEGSALRYQAPKGTVTPELLSQLRDNKPEIIRLLQHNWEPESAALAPIPKTQNRGLSFAQQRLWFLNELEGKNATYNISLALKLAGNLDLSALTQALQTIIERHEILSTSFSNNNGTLIQLFTPNLQLNLPIVNLEALADREQEAQVNILAQQEAQQHFDLAIAPLFRTKLLKRSNSSHVLLLTIHHAIADGWSMGILKKELSILYRDFRSGDTPSLTPLPIRYVDFAEWQRTKLQGEFLDRQVNYWQQQLAQIPPVLDLPIDRSRPAIQTFTGKQYKVDISPEICQQLKQLSQQSGTTLFMTLLSAFGVLLSRYSDREDLVIGSPIANRNHPEIESLIGLFANTLALRIDLQHNPSFRELLTRVRGMCLDAYHHQDLPIEKLVEQLQPERSLSYNPIFQTLFILQNTPDTTIDLTDLTITPFTVDPETSKFDLTLSLMETSAGLAGFWEYNTDLFDDITIDRLNGHFQALLAGIITDPDRSISQLPLLTAPEQQQLLTDWHEPAVAYPQDRCIHHLFETQVATTPEAIAVVFAGKTVTYRELDRQANQLAHYLQSLGVKPEVAVGLCVERSLDLIVGLLGILKAGAAYIPLDPAYPPERLAFMLEDSQISTLVTQQDLLTIIPTHAAQIVCLDRDSLSERPCQRSIVATQPQDLPHSEVTPDNLIYTIYTSGSTGKPKGVQITHANVVNFLTGMQQHLQLTERDRLLAVTSLSFDIAGLEIFLPLSLGACVVFASREIATDGFELLQLLTDSRATIMQATPATWRMLIAAGWQQKSSLKILCGGEALPQNLAAQLCQRSNEVWNVYGPTETTIWSTIDRVRAPENINSIGRPIANTQVYILDKYLQPVPIGVPGELYIGGNGLARGYANRPDLTAASFIQNPLSERPDSRLYKTGDLVRYCRDGRIEYLNRIDNQVKIRGFRIELGEIETVLRQHPAIEHGIVTTKVNDAGETQSIAYIVTYPDRAVSTDEVRSFLKRQLPDYMVPSVFVFLGLLPLTPNGKIDRRALPAPDFSRSAAGTYISARDELELQLTRIWETTLGIQPIGMQDNFFELGGNSLLCVQLVAEIARKFGKNLSVVTLFQAQTIAQLAAVLREDKWAAGWNSLVPIQSGGALTPLFLVHPCSGELVLYRQLAGHLGGERPIYGLQAVGLDGCQIPFDRVELMAAHYLQEIQTIQPQGPYFLGGKHIGSRIAIEMARQLIAQEQPVELVVIFGGFHAAAPIRRLSREWIARQSRKLSQLGLGYLLDRVTEIRRKTTKNTQILLAPIADKLAPASGIASLSAQQRVRQAIEVAGANYILTSYPGRVAIFQPIEDYDGTPPAIDRAHRQICSELFPGGFELHYVPGTDSSDFTAYREPHVRVLAQELLAALDRRDLAANFMHN